jgi:cytochrome c551/c552
MAQDFKGYILLLVFLVFQTINATAAPDGKALFQANCASCHNPYKDATGPALKGVDRSSSQQRVALQMDKKFCEL